MGNVRIISRNPEGFSQAVGSIDGVSHFVRMFYKFYPPPDSVQMDQKLVEQIDELLETTNIKINRNELLWISGAFIVDYRRIVEEKILEKISEEKLKSRSSEFMGLLKSFDNGDPFEIIIHSKKGGSRKISDKDTIEFVRKRVNGYGDQETKEFLIALNDDLISKRWKKGKDIINQYIKFVTTKIYDYLRYHNPQIAERPLLIFIGRLLYLRNWHIKSKAEDYILNNYSSPQETLLYDRLRDILRK